MVLQIKKSDQRVAKAIDHQTIKALFLMAKKNKLPEQGVHSHIQNKQLRSVIYSNIDNQLLSVTKCDIAPKLNKYEQKGI